MGKNTTLLIHKATIADEEAEKARAKMHSTVGHAVEIGKQYDIVNGRIDRWTG